MSHSSNQGHVDDMQRGATIAAEASPSSVRAHLLSPQEHADIHNSALPKQRKKPTLSEILATINES